MQNKSNCLVHVSVIGFLDGIVARVHQESTAKKTNPNAQSRILSEGSILNLQFDIVYTKLFSFLQWKIHYTHILKFPLHYCSENPWLVNSEYK